MPLWGTPITYRESLTRTYGKLGPVPFSDAVLSFTFQGDTKDVVAYSVPGSHGFEILKGVASVQVSASAGGPVLAQGTFLPAAGIFISADCTNGGVGFGSFAVADQHAPNFPGVVAYPGALLGPSCYDLKSNFEVGSGPTNTNFAWVLVNPRFPFAGWNLCGSPPMPLPTSSGDLYVTSMPCQPTTWKRGEFSGTLNGPTALETPDVYFPGTLKRTGAHEFEVSGALGPGFSVGELQSKGLKIWLGDVALVLPKNSMKPDARGWTFRGTVSGIELDLTISANRDADALSFQMKGRRAEPVGFPDFSPVLVAIGDE
ncbi:hypothetical protein DYQ86_18820 [Acidobacteria bacterium AB60]|nr:hypothetical protein DYQ86_18820 [Acidobacteria bacterium AB60]